MSWECAGNGWKQESRELSSPRLSPIVKQVLAYFFSESRISRSSRTSSGGAAGASGAFL